MSEVFPSPEPEHLSAKVEPYQWYDYDWPPKTTADLINFFKQKELEDGIYQGFSGCANVIAGSLDAMAKALRTKEALEISLPLKPGGAAFSLYKDKVHQPHLALMETAYAFTNAKLQVDQLATGELYGLVWWQGRYKDQPMNFIETHTWDDNGDFMQWDIVSEIPNHLSISETTNPTHDYSPRLLKAIYRARMMQEVSTGQIHDARDQGLNYYEFIQGLPVIPDGEEQKAA